MPLRIGAASTKLHIERGADWCGQGKNNSFFEGCGTSTCPYGSTGKGTSGIDKFSSKVHRVHMELGGDLFNSLRIKIQFLQRLQSVSVVDGAAHTQKDDVESNGGSLENVAKVFVLFFCDIINPAPG